MKRLFSDAMPYCWVCNFPTFHIIEYLILKTDTMCTLPNFDTELSPVVANIITLLC